MRSRSFTNRVHSHRPGQVILLIAGHGRAKSTLLEELYLLEVERHWHGDQPAIPVMLRLADCAHASFDPERTFASAIANYFEIRAGATLSPIYLLNCFDQQEFLFLLNGDDDVGDAVLQQALISLREFRASRSAGRRRCPSVRHHARSMGHQDQRRSRGIEVPDHSADECRTCHGIPVVVPARSSGPWTCEAAAEAANGRAVGSCRGALAYERNARPGQPGVVGGTRAEILRRVVDERIAAITGSSGVRGRVEDVLCTLAWEMYSKRKTACSGTELFDLLMKLRGNRDYSLVEFRSQLINPCRVMTGSELDGLRFAYPGFASYCCALHLYRQTPEARDHSLEEITATLGRRSRAQLWDEVLLILAGLGTTPAYCSG